MRKEIEQVLNRFFVAGLATQLIAILAAAAIAVGIWSSVEAGKRSALIQQTIDRNRAQIAEYVFVADVLNSELPKRIAPFEGIQNALRQEGIRGRLELVACGEGVESETLFSMNIGSRRLSRCIQFTPDGLGWTWVFGVILGFCCLCLLIAFGSWRALKKRVMVRVLHPLLTRVEDGVRLQVLGEVASQVSHDIRSPLAALRAASMSLPKGDPNQELIVLAVSRLNGVASQLLGTRKALETMVSDLPAVLGSLIEEKKLEFTNPISLRVDTQAPCPVLADKDELTCTLSNLINNAIEASETGSPVELDLKQAGSFFEVAIRDQGTGFSDHVLSGLERGTHLTTKPNGSGLGLRGALKFARKAGGDLQLRNRPGRGAETILRLPALR